MHGRSAIWFPLVLLALLAALTFWIDRTVQPPQPKRDGSSRHDPDYTMSNFVANKFDSGGIPSDTLAAVTMVHYPDDDSTELIRPRYTQYAQRKATLQIQGQRGLVSSKGDNVHFMDSVKIVQAASGNKGELTVLSEAIHIMPGLGIVKTDQPVRILQAPRTVVTGTGMELNNKLHTFKLLHNVHVHYERPGAPISKPPMLQPAQKSTRKTSKAASPKLAGPAQPTMLQSPSAAKQQKQTVKKAPATATTRVISKNTKPLNKAATQKTTKKTVTTTKKRSTTQPSQDTPAPAKSNIRIRRQYEANH